MPATVRNAAREKLEQGQLSLGVGVRMTRSAELAKAMAVTGFDWLFLDMEHGVMSIAACAQLTTAALQVDVMLIGTNDLCAEMGIHGDFGNERVADAYRTMIAAARKHGKFPGMAGVYNETIMPRYIEMGARFILSGQDAAFMAAGAAQRTGFLRKLSPN